MNGGRDAFKKLFHVVDCDSLLASDWTIEGRFCCICDCSICVSYYILYVCILMYKVL